MSKDFMVDCMITAGELDKSGYCFVDNDLKVSKVVHHNVPYSKFLEWDKSDECWQLIRALERKGRERFGDDYWMKYRVCHFCTLPHKN